MLRSLSARTRVPRVLFRLRRRWLLFALALLACTAPSRADILGDDLNPDEDHDYGGLPNYRLAIETGYSQWMYYPDSISKSYDSYLTKLESGWDYSADLAWFPWPKGGVGINWIWFLSRAKGDNVIIDTAIGVKHSLRERASFTYLGPEFLSRLHFGRFGLLVGGFGAGWLQAHDDWTDNGASNRVSANNIAVVVSLGWEYAFYRFFSAGFNGRVLLADLGSYKYNGITKHVQQPDDLHGWSSISMNRFELNAGLRFGM